MKTTAIILILMLTSCLKHKPNNGEMFVIMPGEHYSDLGVRVSPEHSISGTFKFNKTCEYVLTENVGQINKLVGLSHGMNNHKNSARIGWEFLNGEYIMHSYCYVDGERQHFEIARVVNNQRVEFAVSIHVGYYSIMVNGNTHTIDNNITKLKRSYIQHFHFGGEQPNPNDEPMRVFMDY